MFEYYQTSFSYTDKETMHERFVGVPEEGGRSLISVDPQAPGSVYTAAVSGDHQTSNAVLLARPASFGFHAEAARSNAFAKAYRDDDVAKRGEAEFEGLAQRLADAGVEIAILDDSPEPAKPDAIFPNNWVSFHADGTLRPPVCGPDQSHTGVLQQP